MSIDLYIQRVVDQHDCPTDDILLKWVKVAIGAHRTDAELTIRITDAHEIQHLNHEYRKKNKPTNVLSFPLEAPEGVPVPFWGIS